MTLEEIERRAAEVVIVDDPPIGVDYSKTAAHIAEAIRSAVEVAVKEERLACIAVADNFIATFEMTQSTLGIQGHVAAAIRARGTA